MYKLNGELLWPENENFIWANIQQKKDFKREELIEFSEKFRIVLSTPRPSFDLRQPGSFEKNILNYLKDQIGIGFYPNQSKNDVDVCALIVHLASLGRTSEKEISSEKVCQYIQLRKDFGKVAQEFPVDEQLNLKRVQHVNDFILFSKKQKRTVLVGPPGSGKSWFITTIIKKLKEDKIPVLYHYCFISPFEVPSIFLCKFIKSKQMASLG